MLHPEFGWNTIKSFRTCRYIARVSEKNCSAENDNHARTNVGQIDERIQVIREAMVF